MATLALHALARRLLYLDAHGRVLKRLPLPAPRIVHSARSPDDAPVAVSLAPASTPPPLSDPPQAPMLVAIQRTRTRQGAIREGG